MPHRIAAALALIAFALCLVIGGLKADNTFTTAVLRAIVAMAGTYVIGLLLGWAGQKMLDENLTDEEKKLRNSTNLPADDR